MAPVAKGLSSGYLPIGGVLVSDHVADVITADDFNHGYTYSGHPVCAIAALENLRIIEEEKLVDRVRDDIGPYMAKGLNSLLDHDMVGEVQSVGLMAAVQLTRDKASRARFANPDDVGTLVRNKCVEAGLILRATGDRMLASPPLIITHEEVDFMVRTLRAALDSAWVELR
jgi:putrescine aminotransferase